MDRDEILGYSKKKDIVLNAVKRYNERLEAINTRLDRDRRDPAVALAEGISCLEDMISNNQLRSTIYPNNTAVVKRLENQRSNKTLMEILLARINLGHEHALEPLPERERIRSYDNAIRFLKKKGLLKNVNSRDDLTATVTNAADFQVLLLDSSLELPSPFNYRFLKSPRLRKMDPFDVYLDFIVENEIQSRYDVDVNTIVRDERYSKGRKLLNMIREDPDTRRLAREVVSSIPSFEPVYLLPSTKTRKGFEDRKRTPEVCYAYAFSRLDSNKDYITMTFRGFGRKQNVFLLVNNAAGMRIHLYSEKLKRLARKGVAVDKNDITTISKSYANRSKGDLIGVGDFVSGANGNVISVGGSSERYKAVVTGLVNHYSRWNDDGFPDSAFSGWVDLGGSCDCDDYHFVGELHAGSKQGLEYNCMQRAGLAADYYARALSRHEMILNPYIFPLPQQIMFDKKLANQVLVNKKIGGGVKSVNRTEREWYNMMNVQSIGYESALTTDFNRAKTAMYRMYL
ncbi:hypothetical protein HQ545_02055 [Candidatus Woesearchaeota archaeon]|nr:hypothetical protein [Candidatus Woesearchaeota archaeon]